MSRPAPLTPGRLRAALALEPFDGRAAQREMEPARRGTPPAGGAGASRRSAAALAYVFERDGRLVLPLTLRRADLPEHRGQVSLPGGRPKDGETSWETALRETQEEIGLDEPSIERLGSLALVDIPVSNTTLEVHVAIGEDPGVLVPCPREVEQIVLVGLDDLVDPAVRRTRQVTIEGVDLEVPYFDVAGIFLWGATAMGMADLVARLAAV